MPEWKGFLLKKGVLRDEVAADSAKGFLGPAGDGLQRRQKDCSLTTQPWMAVSKKKPKTRGQV